MGKSNSKNEPKPEDVEQFLRSATHDQLLEAITTKTPAGDKMISKTEANKVLAVQKSVLSVFVCCLRHVNLMMMQLK